MRGGIPLAMKEGPSQSPNSPAFPHPHARINAPHPEPTPVAIIDPEKSLPRGNASAQPCGSTPPEVPPLRRVRGI